MEFKKIKEKRLQCISHAKDLLNGSKLLLDKGLHNIAYHLAALALEEIGKSVMLVVGHVSINSQKGVKLLKQAGEDHPKKLFWALWGPTFGKKDMSKEQIDSFIDLSNKIHFIRLSGLYVDPFQDVDEPNKLVSPKETKNLISIAEARIKMEEYSDIKEPDQQTKDDFIWFASSAEDPEKKKLIFGKKSIDKLKEFNGDAVKWVRWMHAQFDKAEKESKELLQRELSLAEPSEIEKRNKKWRVKFRLKTMSHSLRNKHLNDWNSRTDFIRLNIGKKIPRKSELIVEMILPRGVPLQSLWYASWGEARRLAVSLSIASRGYFWWYLPQDVAKFYEKIVDVESNSEVVVERRPKLELNWGDNVLSASDLVNTAMCYRFLPRGNVRFLNDYVTGLSFFGKNDIHTPFEKEIYLDFYHALFHAMIFYKDYKEGDAFVDSFDRVFKNILKDTTGFREYIEIGEELMKSRKTKRAITLTECGAMKILCDVYIFHRINKLAQEDLKRRKK
ncbi:MAG: AbiV family abortive infection protein [Candidatus Omnitrophica bacterium]|nr:AbiV family abortive infection protein [Candidatus Omnitrophota bacterium]